MRVESRGGGLGEHLPVVAAGKDKHPFEIIPIGSSIELQLEVQQEALHLRNEVGQLLGLSIYQGLREA